MRGGSDLAAVWKNGGDQKGSCRDSLQRPPRKENQTPFVTCVTPFPFGLLVHALRKPKHGARSHRCLSGINGD